MGKKTFVTTFFIVKSTLIPLSWQNALHSTLQALPVLIGTFTWRMVGSKTPFVSFHPKEKIQLFKTCLKYYFKPRRYLNIEISLVIPCSDVKLHSFFENFEISYCCQTTTYVYIDVLCIKMQFWLKYQL